MDKLDKYLKRHKSINGVWFKYQLYNNIWKYIYVIADNTNYKLPSIEEYDLNVIEYLAFKNTFYLMKTAYNIDIQDYVEEDLFTIINKKLEIQTIKQKIKCFLNNTLNTL